MTRISIGLIGLGFTTVGIAFVLTGLPQTRTLSCERLEPRLINCQKTDRIAGVTTQITPLSQLKTAQITSKIIGTEDGDFTIYQVQLLGAQNSITLDAGSPEAAADLAAKLNRFIESAAEASFKAQGSLQSWLHVWVGTASAIGGLMAVTATLKTAAPKPVAKQRVD